MIAAIEVQLRKQLLNVYDFAVKYMLEMLFICIFYNIYKYDFNVNTGILIKYIVHVTDL